MSHMLFVCTGNICRSPFAERYSRHRFAEARRDEWTFSSAGTGALAGHPMETLMRERLEATGASAQDFLARQLDVGILDGADLIITLQKHHRDWVLEEKPALLNRTFTLGQAVRFIAEHGGERRGEEFVDALRGRRSRARRRDDIADPFRRGPEAADKAARQVVSMLDVLLPRLVD